MFYGYEMAINVSHASVIINNVRLIVGIEMFIIWLKSFDFKTVEFNFLFGSVEFS